MYKYLCKTLIILFLFTSPVVAAQVGDWSFNGSDGITEDTAIDTSGQGNDGIIYGAVAVAGKIGQALEFDGINDYVNCGNNSSLNNLLERTYEMWIKPNSWSSVRGLLEKGGSTTVHFRGWGTVDIDGNIGYSDTYASVRTTGSTLALNEWHHLAITYSESGDRKIHVYTDGNETSYSIQIASIGTLNTDAAANLHIGKGRATYYFDGIIDEARIYNVALTPAQVLELYQLGRNILMNPSASGKLKIGEE